MSASYQYDYIITGAGCAGLSLAVHMIQSGGFQDKKILIVDKDSKNKNDRTWCFWEKGEGLFQAVVYKEWEKLLVHDFDSSTELLIRPYRYKLIRGLDFYQYCINLIRAHPNFHFWQADVEQIYSNEETAVLINQKKYTCSFIFNSILFAKPHLHKNEYWMLQHFKGWFINADSSVFNPGEATLMDFSTNQQQGTSFFYVLPFSATQALIEYSVFSKEVYADPIYEDTLTGYVEKHLGITKYTVEEREFGVIPMTNYRFAPVQENIVHIGTAGGQTKGSSGYTFHFIQKHSAALVRSLIEQGHPFSVPAAASRFRFYDSVLLELLYNNKIKGAEIFRTLFRKNKAQKVLKFLDNETSVSEELRIISTLPVLPFSKAGMKQLFS